MNRRFLYMLLSNCNRPSYTLHRINPARLFFPSDAPHRMAAPVEYARLPRPTMRFCPPDSENKTGYMEFMLLGGSKNKIRPLDGLRGRAEYIPEYNLWIGFSDREDGHLCTSDLRAASTARRPVARNVLEACALPKGAIESYLVHLGDGQFCLAKRFQTTHRETCDELCCIYQTTTDMSMIFTGVEVERCGRGLQMVMHKSYRYIIGGSNTPYCVL